MTQLEEMVEESVSLDEIITLPMYDLNNFDIGTNTGIEKCVEPQGKARIAKEKAKKETCITYY